MNIVPIGARKAKQLRDWDSASFSTENFVYYDSAADKYKATVNFKWNSNGGIVFTGNKNVTPGDGSMVHIDAATITDNATAASGTASKFANIVIEVPTLAATNASVTTTDAASLYVAGAPTAGANQTITNAHALWVDSGNTRLDGNLSIGGINDPNNPLSIGNIGGVSGNNFTVNNDTNVGLELRSGSGGTPYIDFSNDSSIDYDARLRLTGSSSLVFEGALIGINSTTPDAMLEIVTNGISEEGLHIKGSAGQVSNLFYVTDSSDVTMFNIDNAGGVSARNLWLDANLTTSATGNGSLLHVDTGEFTYNSNTSASATVPKFTTVTLEGSVVAAVNSSVTTTDAATLYISGAPTASTNQTITNAYSLWVDSGNARFDGQIRLYDSDASNYIAIQSPATVASNVTLTLPGDDGVADQVMKTDGSGVLSWVDVSSLSSSYTWTVSDSSNTTSVASGSTVVIQGTANEIEVSNSSGTLTVGLPSNVTISGDLTISGTTTTVNTSTLSVEDPLILLASGNTSNDVVDIGFYGLMDVTGSQDVYAGLFRDAGDTRWKLFDLLQAAPTTTVDTSGTGYDHADLQVGSLYADDNVYIGGTAIAEKIQDITGGMVTGNTETLITVTYEDSDGTLDFVVDNDLSNYDNSSSGFITATLTQEEVEDYVGGMLDGTETFIDVSYNDTNGNINFVVPVKDEDNMASNSASYLATQQSIKTYVDSQVATENTIAEMNDANVSSPAAGHLLIYDNTASVWDNATLTEGSNITITNGDGSITIAADDVQLTEGQVEDYVGGMVTGNTETLITVTYQDSDGTLDFVIDNDLSNYDNATSGFLSGSVTLGTQTAGNYVATIADAGNSAITVANSGQESAAVTLDITNGGVTFAKFAADTVQLGSESFADSDTTIMTAAAIKDKIESYGFSQTPGLSEEQVEDYVGGMVTGNTETGITVTYQDSTNDIDFVVSDTTVAGNSGSTGITPGDTLTISGGTNATTVMSGNTLTINIDDAFLVNNADDTTTGIITAAGFKASNQNAVELSPHGTSAGNTGEIRFLELAANGTNYVGFKSPDAIGTSDSQIYVLPTADGNDGQQLTTDGSGTLSWSAAATAAGTPTAITVADTTDTTAFVALFESATGDLGPKTDAGITYNAGTGMLTATGFTGPLTGNATTVTNGVYTSNNLSVMAATTSAQLKTVISDETGSGELVFATSPTLVTPALGTPASGALTNCTFPTLNQDTTGTATIATTVTVADTTDTSAYVALFESATGDLGPKTDAGITYNAGTGTLTATAFSGPLTGDVAGDVSGSSGSCTGNAATATALATGRTIGMTGDVVWTSASFTGSGNVTGTATIQANSVDGTMIALGSDDGGDIMYYNGTNYIRLAKGSDDQVLTLASGVPSWANASGGGASALNDLSDVTYSSGNLTITSLDTIVAGPLTVDSSANITLDADGGTIQFADAGVSLGTITSSGYSGNAATVTNGVYTTNNLSVMAATTSSQLAGVMSDETGSGALVFATSPTLVTPALGTPASGNLANCTFPTLNQDTTGTATIATTVTVADESSDTTCFPLFVTAATGNLAPKSGSNLAFNSSSGALTATSFAGDITGDLTGNADTVTNGVYTSNNLSVMAATTSAQLAGVMSDETGSGALVFATSPTLVTPALGTPSALVGTNISGTAASLTVGAVNSSIQNAVELSPHGTSAGNTGEIRLLELAANGTNYVGFKAPDATDGQIYVLPAADGSDGQQLTTDGDGILSWAAAASASGTPTTITVADTTDTTSFVALFESATGDLGPKTDAGITYNAGTGMLTATGLTGPLTGNAATVTNGVYTSNNLSVMAATTSAQLAGVMSDETGSGALVFATSPTLVTPALGTPASGNLASCTFPTLNQDTTGTATIATTVTVADESSDTTCFPLFVTAETGNLGPKSGTNLAFNSSTGILTATGFAGDVTGDLTGNADTVTNGVYTSNNLSVMAATTSAQLAGVISDETGSGVLVFGTSPTLVTPALGTPSALVGTNISGTAASLTAGAVTNGVYTTNNLSVMAATTSAQLAGVISNETGSGALVFGTSPTLVTPALGTPSALVGTNISGTAASLTVGAVNSSIQNAVELSPHGTSAGNTGEIRLLELAANGTNYVGFKGPDATDGQIYVLPAADGSDGQQLTTDGDGTLSWAAAASASGTPTTITVADTTDTTSFVALFESDTGDLGPKTDAGITYNAGTGMLTATGLTGPLTGNATTVTNGVYTTNNLSVMAATTSAQLAGVISNETGSGALVFATSPTLVTPALGTPASGNLANCTFPTLNQDTTGNAATVTTNANLTGHITSTGNAAILGSFTVAQLSTALSDVSISGNNTGDQTSVSGNAGTATTATNVIVSDSEVDNSNHAITFVDDLDGSASIGIQSDGDLHYNPSTGTVTATLFSGSGASLTTLNGSNISSGTVAAARVATLNQDTTGNAATVTNGVYTSNNLSVMAATTSAQLAGVISNETGSGALVFGTSPTLVTPVLGTPASGNLANCTFPTLNQDTTGTATIATTVTVADESSDTTCFPLFVTAATGNLGPKSGTNLAFNSSSGALTATSFVGDITGALTGNADTVTNGVYTSNNLSVMAATTSAQLAGVISNETGSGALVFGTSPTLVTPALGTPSALVGTNISGTAANLTVGAVTNGVYTTDSGTVSNTMLANSSITVSDGSNTSPVALGGTMTFSGTTNEVTVVEAAGTVTIGLPDDVTIAGNLTVNGDTVTVNTATLSVEDPLIILASGNNGADSVDIGFYGLYDTSGSLDLYAGLFRDAGDGKFRLFKDLQAAPTTTVNTSGTGYAKATLVADIEGALTGNADTVTNGVYTSNNLSVMAATTSAQLAGVISNETGSGALVFGTSPTLVTPALGTPSALVGTNISGTAASLTAGAVTNGVYTSNNLSVMAATTSAQLAGVISNETGSGALVFGTSPTLVTPVLGTPASGTLTNCTFPTLNQDTTGTATIATTVTVADESSDTTCFPLFVTAATGNLGPKSGTNLAFDSSSGALTATSFVGDITGDLTGNADTVTNGVYTSNNLSVMAATTSAQLAGVISDETGSGALVFGTSPTLATPALGTPSALVGTNISGTAANLTAGAVTNGVYTSNNLSVMAATTSAQLAGVISDETGSGALVFGTSPTLATPALGTPSALVGTNISGTAANLTAGAVTNGVYTSNNLSVMAATTSAQLAGVISNETGSGSLVFGTSPTLVTPALGTPSALVGTNITWAAGTVAQASDYMVFLDNGATGDVKTMSIDAFLSAIAGSGISVSSSQLTASGGGGSGTMTTVKSNGSAVGGADIVTLDFSSEFTVGETPDTEINISMAAAQTAITSVGTLAGLTVEKNAGLLASFKRITGDGAAYVTIDSSAVNNDEDAQLRLKAGVAGKCRLYFGDTDDADIGQICYEHSDNSLGIKTNNTTAISISSAQLATFSGRVMVDDTTAATSTTDGSLQTDGGLSVALDAVVGDDLILLSDASAVHFGASKEITLTHVADSGLTLKHTAGGDNKPLLLTLATGETTLIADEVLSKLAFQAPSEASGGDSVEVAAAIQAVAEGAFNTTSNATRLEFMTGASEAATSKMTLSSAGVLNVSGAITQAPNTATDGGAVDIDCSLSNYHEILMNADATSIVFTNATAGQRIVVRFKQHSSHIDLHATEGWNSVTVNGSSGTLHWAGGIEPTLTESNNAIDVYGFLFTSTVTTVHGFIIGQDIKA